MDSGVVIAFVLFAAVGGVIWYFSWLAGKKRQEAFNALATRQGWRWLDEDETYVDRWDGDPFGTGNHRRAKNILVGSYADREILYFDYSYQTESGSGDNRRTTTHNYAVWVVRLPNSLPPITVGPEGIFGGRIAGALGFGDLQTESEDFNRSFKVRCDDQRYGMALIHPRMMEYLMNVHGLQFRIDGDSLICWEEDHPDVDAITPRLDSLFQIVDLVPSFVWKDYGLR
ncbi:DUF3137 domain-containing protein [Flindersiella endophytica]